jgi:hypothetical protein
LTAAACYAQSQKLETSNRGTKSSESLIEERLSSLLTDNQTKTTQPEVALGKKLHASGPVVRTFKVKKVLEAPRRFFEYLNPFTPGERAPSIDKAGKLSTRAWATTVGIRPGTSAFSDATTHESTMTLLTLKP